MKIVAWLVIGGAITLAYFMGKEMERQRFKENIREGMNKSQRAEWWESA